MLLKEMFPPNVDITSTLDKAIRNKVDLIAYSAAKVGEGDLSYYNNLVRLCESLRCYVYMGQDIHITVPECLVASQQESVNSLVNSDLVCYHE